MNNLEPYRSYFDQAYPNYSDSKYGEISKLVFGLPTLEKVSEILDSDIAKTALEIVAPLVKIKNYKSQIPFPPNLYDAARVLAEIKNSDASDGLSGHHGKLFEKLINIDGFQLPTVSAVLHFCHPKLYPIVDRNIEAACCLLSREHPEEFDYRASPTLPASTTSKSNKLAKYQAFILFLSKVKQLHNEQHQTNYDFRKLDKSLMVFGVSKLRKAAEDASKSFQRPNC